MSELLKKYLFIINPISGFRFRAPANIRKLIRKNFLDEQAEIRVRKTRHPNHAALLGEKGKTEHFDVVVAVGGDGTINQISNQLAGTGIAMGIIPRGSGNGLARFLNIPLKAEKALQILKAGNTRLIDTAFLDDKHFVNIAGIGFDAHIANAFAGSAHRGILSYIKLTLSEFAKYKAEKYSITINGETHEEVAFLISFANSSQYGSNAYISPEARIDDGLIDVVIMRPFPLRAAVGIAYRMLSRSIHNSKYVKIFKSNEIIINHSKKLKGHVDGEPVTLPPQFTVSIKPASLTVICPE